MNHNQVSDEKFAEYLLMVGVDHHESGRTETSSDYFQAASRITILNSRVEYLKEKLREQTSP